MAPFFWSSLLTVLSSTIPDFGICCSYSKTSVDPTQFLVLAKIQHQSSKARLHRQYLKLIWFIRDA